jgi:hypothetical protein
MSYSLSILDLTVSERDRLEQFRLHFNGFITSIFNFQVALWWYQGLDTVSLFPTFDMGTEGRTSYFAQIRFILGITP